MAWVGVLAMGISIGVVEYWRGRVEQAKIDAAKPPVVKEWWQGLPSGDYACTGPTNCVRLDIVPAPQSANVPKPIYIPERNDYVCPMGWTPAGGWKENGVPLDPYRPIGCKLEKP